MSNECCGNEGQCGSSENECNTAPVASSNTNVEEKPSKFAFLKNAIKEGIKNSNDKAPKNVIDEFVQKEVDRRTKILLDAFMVIETLEGNLKKEKGKSTKTYTADGNCTQVYSSEVFDSMAKLQKKIENITSALNSIGSDSIVDYAPHYEKLEKLISN